MTTDVAVPEDDLIGLEDFDDSEIVVPRIKIIGPDAEFEDQLTNERFTTLNVILLGLVRKRVLWNADEAESEAPMCRSNDATNGNPADDFPWVKSGFDKAAFGDEPQLPCESCPLKEWGSHPQGKKPWCSEVHEYPLLVVGDKGNLAPALFSVQRSGISNSRKYMSGFKRARMPLFTAFTQITLTPHKTGTVKWAEPVFAKKGATDEADYPDFATKFRTMRAFSQAVRTKDADETTAPASSAVAPASQPADEDEIPF